MKKEDRSLYKDKVEISIVALIEIKRAFRALSNDKNSYLHKVFNDDYVFIALNEIEAVYNDYFEEGQPVKK